MNFKDLLENTRTYHSFEETNVDSEFVHKLIETALKAPNHKFTFPWKYIWAKGKVKDRIAELFFESKKSKLDPELGRDEDFFKNKILNPELIILIQEKADDTFTLKEDHATLSCSVQLMALYLRELGYAYKWSTGGTTRDERLYEILNLNSEKQEVIGFFLFGKGVGNLNDRRRPEVKDVLITTT